MAHGQAVAWSDCSSAVFGNIFMREQVEQNFSVAKWNICLLFVGNHQPVLVKSRFKSASDFAPREFSLTRQFRTDHTFVKNSSIRVLRCAWLVKRMLMRQKDDLNTVVFRGERLHLEGAML